MVKFIADKIADIKEISIDKIIDHTTKNALNFFKKLIYNNNLSVII